MKLKTFNILNSIIIGLVMSVSMSLFNVILRVGFNPDFLIIWGKSFLPSFLVAIVLSVLVIPQIRKQLQKRIRITDE